MSLASQTLIFPFEFCAARYLRLWETREQAFHKAISTRPTSSDIVEALRYFRVARNFAGLQADRNAATKIRTALRKVSASRSLTTPVAKVDALATMFESDFGQYNLSASTKLLWLSSRTPYVLYDRRAVTALSRVAGHRKVDGNYHEFTTAWRAEYSTFHSRIRDAIRELPAGRAFMPRSKLTNSQLTSLSSKAWFTERVFDIFLWEIGGDS